MSELFWRSLPELIAIGMPVQEFWHGDPRLATAYRRAHGARSDNRRYEAWTLGHYFYEAMLAASPAYRELSKGIEHEYPALPYGMDSEERKAERAARAQARRNREAMEAFAAAWNARFEEKAAEGGEGDAEWHEAADGEVDAATVD